MTLLRSLFVCCASQSQSEKNNADARHARIVSVVQHHESQMRARSPSLSYRDSPPSYADIAQHPLIAIDEKNADEIERDNYVAAPLSDRSSIVSIPSTRLTDLTSMNTGETTHSGRRPPSYHASPGTTYTPAASAGRDGVWGHPVMSNDWLQILQDDAVGQAEEQRRLAHG
jgi:hypothetical protein